LQLAAGDALLARAPPARARSAPAIAQRARHPGDWNAACYALLTDHQNEAAMRPLHPTIGPASRHPGRGSEVRIPLGSTTLHGELTIDHDCDGLVVFVHGSGSSRYSPRNRTVAQALHATAIGTLLFDLRSIEEESLDRIIGWLRFEPQLLAQRLLEVTGWLQDQPLTRDRRLGFFGAGTGAAAALLAAAELPAQVRAVVCRGGRPDLAAAMLPHVKAATLLIVGDRDPAAGSNRQALTQLGADKELVLLPGVSHLFHEPGALEQVAALASTWFRGFLSTDLDLH
jgi:putative phosphoribosyl transferase